MARAIWSGVMTFGLVSLPVQLYSATKAHGPGFHQFEKGTDVVDLTEALRASVEAAKAKPGGKRGGSRGTAKQAPASKKTGKRRAGKTAA